MLWVNLLFVVIFALGLSAILGWGFRWRHPSSADAIGASIVFLFLVLLLTMWAAGAWLPPFGPVMYGTSWLGLLLVGVLVALLLLAVGAPAPPPPTPGEAAEEAREAAAVGTAFGLFFWIRVVGLLVAAIVGYFV